MIPWTIKGWWQMRLLDVVKEWAGVGKSTEYFTSNNVD